MNQGIEKILKSLKENSVVHIFADGACSGNPGPGGWGAVIACDGMQAEICGGEPLTTNNRMELAAAIESIRLFPPGTHIALTTDSLYLKNGITAWITQWKKNGWRTSSRAEVKNKDLWESLDHVCQEREIEWLWVKGHNGVVGNERADTLARQAIIQVMMGMPLQVAP